jgi:hypothetical protein
MDVQTISEFKKDVKILEKVEITMDQWMSARTCLME